MPDIPTGSLEAVLEILRASPAPLRRRKILEALETNGRRISLAGLNRILEIAQRRGLISDGPDGVREGPPPR
ncbi:MAG TPA: hypothetical protein VGS23_08155 [Thermoplasmata archaeon]|nr:hypothetical protein [Thermoplasmata archaeon]